MVQQNTDGTPEHWQNTGTLTEQLKTSRKTGIPQKSRAGEHQRNNGTTKRHREILSVQNCDILKRQHNRIQNQKVVFMKDFYGKVKPGQETFARKWELEPLHKGNNILKLKLYRI